MEAFLSSTIVYPHCNGYLITYHLQKADDCKSVLCGDDSQLIQKFFQLHSLHMNRVVVGEASALLKGQM